MTKLVKGSSALARVKPRLHVLSLPHTQTTREFNACAYTSKVRKLATMMTKEGYPVTLYASDENEAECNELVSCITRAEQHWHLKNEDWYRRGEVYGLPYDPEYPLWQFFNTRVCAALAERLADHDVICLATGTQRPIVDAYPQHMSVETGVGYEGTCSQYRVFESYAWMHAVYGHQQGASAADGQFFDAVIPNFFEPEDFPLSPASNNFEPYCLFMSRMTPRKGYDLAIEATRRASIKLIIAGVGGDKPEAEHVEYAGLADSATRAELMGGATALLAPTHYLEPFGGVVVEAMLCGTPVITTDWGAFSENVQLGVDGFRCRTMAEFVQAIGAVKSLDRKQIHERAVERFSLAAVGPQYDRYFSRLQSLWGEGFYQTGEPSC